MKFIAEIGWNFVGDLSLAKEMIIAASNSKATYAKFQVWDPVYLKSGPWDNDGRRKIYEKAFLNKKKLLELKNFCDSQNIIFLASVFEKRSLSLLSQIDQENIKIPSHECNNWELIEAARKTFKNVFLSIGAVNKIDFKKIVNSYGADKNMILMHCVSTYPLNPENVNLPKITRLNKKCKNIGYSSHFFGIDDAVAATALGVEVIEKHFTTNRKLPGRDNKFALLPKEFKKMVNKCKIVNEMTYDKGNDIQNVEKDVANVMRGRWDAKLSS